MGSATPGDEPGPPRSVALGELVSGFLRIGLLGFGGVAPWARHVIVEERAWLSEAEYAAVLGVAQALPGANTVNAAVMIGDRFRGPVGAAACVAAMMAMPLVILIAAAAVYGRFSSDRDAVAILAGGGAAAAGLVIGTALKMLRNLALTRTAVAFCAAAFVAIGVLRWPLLSVMAVLVPAALAIAAWERRA